MKRATEKHRAAFSQGLALDRSLSLLPPLLFLTQLLHSTHPAPNSSPLTTQSSFPSLWCLWREDTAPLSRIRTSLEPKTLLPSKNVCCQLTRIIKFYLPCYAGKPWDWSKNGKKSCSEMLLGAKMKLSHREGKQAGIEQVDEHLSCMDARQGRRGREREEKCSRGRKISDRRSAGKPW